jgi:ParB/RepB/Spo0J family partition protein
VADTGRQVQYEIVAGERRFRACQLAGLERIPAMVCSMSDAEVLEAQVVENLQRADLTELEEAEGYVRLMRHGLMTAEVVAGVNGFQ